MPTYVISSHMQDSICRKLRELKQYNMIGILTSDEVSANRVYQWLQTFEEPVQLINKPNDEMQARIIVMPLVLSKGLEFDAVLMCNFLEEWENAKQKNCVEKTMHTSAKLYLACTRALHELYVVEKQELPTFLQDCKKYLEIVEE